MSNASSNRSGSPEQRVVTNPTIGRQLRRTGLATKVLLVVAVALALLGTAGSMLGPPTEPPRAVGTAQEIDPPPAPSGSGSPQLPRLGLDAGGGRSTIAPALPGSADADDPMSGPTPATIPGESSWLSPVARGLGISFIAAFAVGVFSRVFLRIAIAAAGIAVLMLLGLERGGFIEVHWAVLESQTGGLAGWLSAQTESMRTFLMGSLPSGAAAATGFFLGFRRR